LYLFCKKICTNYGDPMKILPVLFASLLLSALPACKSLPHFVINEGPQVLRTSTALGAQWALAKSEATVAQAAAVKAVLLDVKTLVNTGTPPVYVLDQAAELLNAKISSPIVRAMIQAGILTLKTKVVIPVNGTITPEIKLWVNAVLDGAVDGCDAYRPGATPMGTQEVGTEKISFR
jgi:hypothetical protein